LFLPVDNALLLHKTLGVIAGGSNMARPPRQYSGSLSSGQASYVLERLIGERRVSANDIERYVQEMKSEISTLEQRLQRLKDAAGSAAAGAAAGLAAGAATVAAAAIGRRRGRKPGRKPGRPAGTPGRKPGRPVGSGRGPGRPPASASAGGNAPAATPARAGAKRGRKGGTSSITPEQLASRQLQGRYLALVRGFPETRRSYFAKVAKEKGREAAIKEMQESKK
jgi:hypothetical protein